MAVGGKRALVVWAAAFIMESIDVARATKEMERRRVHFSGHVQGVGFRYTAASVARRYAVTGYVQNLFDGRVVLVAEGQAAELDRFLGDLGAAMRGNIQNTQTDVSPPSGEFSGFEVRY